LVSLFSEKIVKIVSTRCHFFEAKMHQIRFFLGLYPIPTGEAHRALPNSLPGFLAVLLLREERGGKERGKEGRGKKGGKEREGGKAKGEEPLS